MYAVLDKNKWPLLAFAVLMLAGLQMFIGNRAWDRPAPQQPAAPPVVEAVPVAETPTDELVQDLGAFYSGAEDGEEADFEYVGDEELIDSTAGFDPSPGAEENFDEGEGDGGYGESPESYNDEGNQGPTVQQGPQQEAPPDPPRFRG